MKVITSFLAILAISAVTSFGADAPKKPKMTPEEMFTKKDADKDGKVSKEEFLKGAKARGMAQLKGHRSVGGMRASIYNAMPLAGVQALVAYMKDFAASHG